MLVDNDAEDILMVLANPIAWRRPDFIRPEGEMIWIGTSDRGEYRVSPPPSIEDVDATMYLTEWNVSICKPGEHDELFGRICVATAEQGKEICRIHALTGDREQVIAARDAAMAEGKRFIRVKLAALEQLQEVLKATGNPPELNWPADNVLARVSSARGTRGDYEVHFEPGRRWVVTTAEVGDTQHCFQTRAIARIACNIHSHTGKWHGML